MCFIFLNVTICNFIHYPKISWYQLFFMIESNSIVNIFNIFIIHSSKNRHLDCFCFLVMVRATEDRKYKCLFFLELKSPFIIYSGVVYLYHIVVVFLSILWKLYVESHLPLPANFPCYNEYFFLISEILTSIWCHHFGYSDAGK